MDSNKVLVGVFKWMFIGLLITFLTGYYVSLNTNMVYNVVKYFWLFAIIELIAVVVLSSLARKMNAKVSMILFLLYSFISGLTFSSVFLMFNISSIINVFLISSILFGVFAFLGHKTNIDLSKMSTIFYMVIIGSILVTVINLFFNSNIIDILVSIVLIIVFLGVTAYDMQKIKRLSMQLNDINKVVIIGALDLYLDFINIFIRILSVSGRRD